MPECMLTWRERMSGILAGQPYGVTVAAAKR